MLLIHWGTALLQRVPRDGSDPLLRLTAGLLYNLRFPLRMLDECLPLCGKTIRSVGLALRECSPAELVRWILGRSGEGALSADQKQYVRVRYAELRLERRDYREAIRSELVRFWGCEVCGEVLRRFFREVDAEAAVQIIGPSGIYHLLEPETKSSGFRVPRPTVRPPRNRGILAGETPCHRQVSIASGGKRRLRPESLNSQF